MYQGKYVRAHALGEGLVELCFDREGESINKFDDATTDDLGRAVAAIAAEASVRGVLVTSAKSVFVVGADITEFGRKFKLSESDLATNVAVGNGVFCAFEDLRVPSVVALNGYALGGGFEFALCATYRVMSTAAQVGLPEVKLGLFPGLGGTVRLPRVAGAQVAIDWIASGQSMKAEAAHSAGAVDVVAAPELLRDAALSLLRRAVAKELNWHTTQQRKRDPLVLPDAPAFFATALAKVQAASAKHQPAAADCVKLMMQAASLTRDMALVAENRAFAAIAKTQAADALVQTFLSDQALKKLFKQHAKQARPLKLGAVLGAGIMGGGIAYTSALRGTPVRMKDIAQAQLDLGTSEARKLLARAVSSGRQTQDKADAILASITPQLDYANFDQVDVVIEAIVENLGIKHKVLADLENQVRADAVIASNTSSLRIDDLAKPLARPENFVGMHFFNPVPVMPLVEVIQGTKTSDAAVSTAVGYAVAMGKTPIVVKDCPGFLVNRILTAYMHGFLKLIADGADFEAVDRAMEAFGWPMGPAYLEDVIGMDTGSHVSDIISAGYPARMPVLPVDALKIMVNNKRFGQKSGLGFYQYETDPKGKPKRSAAPDTRALLAEIQPNGTREFGDAEIVDRMMLPLIIEAAHSLEEGVVATPAELDQALLMGIGFPAYLGGALKYADWLGLSEVVTRCGLYSALGQAYEPTARMREMAVAGQRYYG